MTWSPRRRLALACLGFALYGYPGYLAPESMDQLLDARAPEGTGWHAPALSLLWNVVEYLVSGPAGMFVLQGGAALAGLYLLLGRGFAPRRAATIAGVLLLSPPVLTTLAVVWRDALLTAFLLLGAGALLATRRRGRWLALAVLTLGAMMREAGLVATAPLVVGLFVYRDGAAPLRRYGVAIVAWGATAVCVLLLGRCQVDAGTMHDDVELAAFDIAGTLRSAAPIAETELAPHFVGVHVVAPGGLQRAATLVSSPLAILVGPRRLFVLPVTLDEARALVAARDSLVRGHRGAYLAHRGKQLARNLGMFGYSLEAAVATFPTDDDQRIIAHFVARHSYVQRALVDAAEAIMSTPLGTPYVYFVVALLVLPFAIRLRVREAVALLASGLGYQLASAFTTTGYGFRYSHWMVTCTLVACALVIARRMRPLRLGAHDRELAR